MITWIQKTFQQHFRLIFLVLLAVVIVSFIFVTNASSGLGRSEFKAAKRPFFGLDLSNEQDSSSLMRDGSVSAILLYGGRVQDSQMQQYAFSRRAMLHTADQLNIPAPSEATLKAYIQTIPIFMSRQGTTEQFQFDANSYNLIRKEPSRLGIRVTPADFARIISEDARIQSVNALVAGPGYVLPADVQQLIKQADSTWTLQTATIDRSSYKPTITTSEIDLTKYFEAHRSSYTILPRVRVSYAEITPDKYRSSITLGENEIRAFYDANPARVPKPATTAPATLAAPSTPEGDYTAVRAQVEAALRQQRANAAANKAASDLAYKLYTEKVDPASPELARLLIQSGATLSAAADFSEADIPAQFGANRGAVAREAFNLDANNRVSNAVNTGNGAVILFWQQSIPAREPAFLEVREKVSADYTAQETTERFITVGKSLKTQIETALKTGSTFEQAVTKASSSTGVTATTKTLAPFAFRTASAGELDSNIADTLMTLNQGEVSNMAIVENNGRFIYVQNCQIPDLTEANPNYALFARQIASRNAMSTAGQYAQNLVEAELAKSAPATQ